MKAIVAVNNNFHIGKKGTMMWRCSADLKHFKALTEGQKCLVGNTTKKGLPPLKNRELLVVSRSGEEGTMSLKEALEQKPDWLIGGEQLYTELLNQCTELHISHINDNTIGDAMFHIPANFQGQIFHYYFEPNEVT